MIEWLIANIVNLLILIVLVAIFSLLKQLILVVKNCSDNIVHYLENKILFQMSMLEQAIDKINDEDHRAEEE